MTPSPSDDVRALAGNLLVTGAGRGIGAATAVLAAAAGWRVAVNYVRDESSANDVVHRIERSGGEAFAVRADVGDEAQVFAMFAQLDERWSEVGGITGLVNNAGIVAMKARLDQMAGPRLERMLAVNVLGVWVCAREAVRRMSTRHGGRGGVIVNVSSGAALRGGAGTYVDYASTQGAVDTFTVGLAREVAGEGIRVNGVRPGIIATQIHADSGDADRAHAMSADIPLGRPGGADEVGQAIVWLLSGSASYVAGATIDVHGGR